MTMVSCMISVLIATKSFYNGKCLGLHSGMILKIWIDNMGGEVSE